jgi:hypothetical protein
MLVKTLSSTSARQLASQIDTWKQRGFMVVDFYAVNSSWWNTRYFCQIAFVNDITAALKASAGKLQQAIDANKGPNA